MNRSDTIPADQKITLTAECLVCGATKHITGNHRTWQRWREHQLTTNQAFKRLAPTDRTWLLNGLCPDELQ